jgi:hypothetical protein
MSAQDAALLIATVSSPVVAIVVSAISAKTARRVADITKQTADADRDLSLRRLTLESGKDQTEFFRTHQRAAYLEVLEIIGGLESTPGPSQSLEDWTTEQGERLHRLASCRANLRLFGAPGLARHIDRMKDLLAIYDVATPEDEQAAWSAVETEMEDISRLMRQDIGAQPE